MSVLRFLVAMKWTVYSNTGPFTNWIPKSRPLQPKNILSNLYPLLALLF